MAQRDYVSRGRSNPRQKGTGKKKNQAQGLPKTTLAVAVALVVMFIGGLYFIAHTKNDSVQNTPPPAHHSKNQGLPPKPEERWTYIKELENRPVGFPSIQEPTSANQPTNQPAKLTQEQLQLLAQMEADIRQPPTPLKEVPYNSEPVPRSQVIITPPEQKPLVAQEKTPTAQSLAPNETNKSPKPAINESKLMLQCGSFRTIEQAESVRASLAFAGIESQITTKDNWNRVVVGPYKNKEAAEKIRSRVTDAGVPGCILRPTGG
ncbi:cell division protein FtsN [Xenorhabdus bovienii]|uniref:cell division protein FtsN n=1 Tax=Xenorhabdus bovienii TaxID=40576 RepID=UPI00237C9021|nr:cell division protein FtsN [Xenorhabdus bovienii]MDE1482411.1 cell division protein FtsN [Xenorhabdus bovienii]MDE9433358.1 cell division protein FtsN [Xenorhabdus bovienii]MDE9435991.1 cell division protein FtsN [Xenorhabdus bovienii]MDE9441493.1 cell division protein FtsN [Xenorhabdus bovienii]MDE9491046.1 cell division protein FtsN [Xenorhabdus bovienii]